MLKLLSGLFDLVSTLLTLFNNRKIGEAAVNKAELVSDAEEIQSMREAKDFADRLTPASAEQLREQLNDRK